MIRDYDAYASVLKLTNNFLDFQHDNGIKSGKWFIQKDEIRIRNHSGGSQSFNAVNQMRLLGRWMRMITIPNQSSVAKAFQEFDEAGRMKPSSYYDRVVDVMEELMKFTLLTRGCASYLTSRYSERKEEAGTVSKRVGQHKL